MEEEFETPLVYKLATGKITIPVFSRWSAPRQVEDAPDPVTIGDSEDVDDNASTGSSGSMPPLVDHVSDSD
ncbi:hypothetical protein TRAPUB_2845 [Trametes pubescens]|nr:hypothetical protein TRAPUB_2845 [Trametes pubescens]